MITVSRSKLDSRYVIVTRTIVVEDTITAAEYDLIKKLNGHKISATKFVRDQHQYSLKEAKDIVDAIHSNDHVDNIPY